MPSGMNALTLLFNFSRENIKFNEITLVYLAFDAGGAADTVSRATAGQGAGRVAGKQEMPCACDFVVLDLRAPPEFAYMSMWQVCQSACVRKC